MGLTPLNPPSPAKLERGEAFEPTRRKAPFLHLGWG
jgi:hypothetical protein